MTPEIPCPRCKKPGVPYNNDPLIRHCTHCDTSETWNAHEPCDCMHEVQKTLEATFGPIKWDDFVFVNGQKRPGPIRFKYASGKKKSFVLPLFCQFCGQKYQGAP
jgi:hypothetical protein